MNTLCRARLGPLLLLALILSVASCSKPADADRKDGEKTLYTCSMHPQIVRDKPGDCPICGMKLTPMKKPAASPAAVDRSIAVDARTIQAMGVRIAPVERGPLVKDIRALARIDFNETTVSDVNVREAGWIEKLAVDSVGQLVHRGQPLFDFFSPELLVAQKEYLLAAERGADYAAQTVVKLRNVGISPSQIAELQRTRQARQVVHVESPRDGFVVEKNAIAGQMVEKGAKLYRIADLATVWVLADIYESDLPFVRVGQTATVRLSYLPDRVFNGRVTYVYPTVNEKTRAARVRMEFYNPGYFLKPGMYATVDIRAQLLADAVLVPAMAVLRSGERNTVFVDLGEGRFEPRAISLGARGAGDVYQVLDGLKPGERVVTSGQFLLDSESQLREAMQKMSAPESGAPSRPPAKVPAATPAPGFVCPMPEHVSIVYDHPGKCPICGMTLVPVSEAKPAKGDAHGDH